MSRQIIPSRVGLFWTDLYGKEKIEELKELIKKMEKADTAEMLELIPKAIYLLIRLYDWSLGGELSDAELLADLIAEVAEKHLELDQDEVENLLEELEHKLK